jgi:hypothetical protein
MRRYSSIQLLNTPRETQGKPGIQYRKTVMYPVIPLRDNDIYVITTAGDRYDNLAQKYYSDASLWWIIACGNSSLEKNSIYPPLGIQLRIPANLGDILTKYQEINTLR